MYFLLGVFLLLLKIFLNKIYIDLKKDFLFFIIKGRKLGCNKIFVCIYQYILNVFFIDILDILYL